MTGDGDAAEMVCVGKRLGCLWTLRILLCVLRKNIHLHTYSRDEIRTRKNRKLLFDREVDSSGQVKIDCIAWGVPPGKKKHQDSCFV